MEKIRLNEFKECIIDENNNIVAIRPRWFNRQEWEQGEELVEVFNKKLGILNEGIVEALKNIEHDLRLINHKRWMVWNDTNREWEVYESKKGEMGKLIITTRDEGEAVYYLLSE